MTKEKNTTTENLILEAAKSVFQLKGMDGARMQEIADEAGINKAMLHYYYRSKQLLFEAVFKNAFKLMTTHLGEILNDDLSIEEKIRNFTFNHISFIMEHPYMPGFIFQELNRNPEFILNIKKEIGLPNLEKFKKQLDDEVKNGHLKPTNAEQLFINIIALNAFPFLGAPLLKAVTNMEDLPFEKLLDERKIEVANFIINSIKV
ncbi:TetR/AcrR family transcriptional regulator [Flavivirga jejuensis]|uniref:TetR/AcrR family transcriptional regulator n=1 Tax=Flavivirga jejuensis TaxID=870487 RepID=A0ABT8WIK5_9FLAO|nr:TetR/AcrR family transcriptional regulator [Flavivirga jejuensis]MDO5972976.1 TetR/AcrR family transcriptional regulator [Flavivirga jejuensis]